MVHTFIIHTLFPGDCKVLFYNVYGNDNATADLTTYDETKLGEIRIERKQQIQYIAEQVWIFKLDCVPFS